MPKVSIIIPSYNYARFIKETLESVFSQTYKDFEVILVDDGSTDNTLTITKRYLPKIRYIRHPVNLGFAPAMNTGIREAKGKYLNFLSADDKLLPTFLEKEVAVLEKYPKVGLVFSPVMFMDKKGDEIGKQKIKNGYINKEDGYQGLLTGNFVNLVTALVRSDTVMKVGFFNSKLRQNPDWDMWIRIAKKSHIAYVPEYLAVYRQHDLNLTAEVKRNFKKIGKEKRIILQDTVKRQVPKKLSPWMFLLFLDSRINTERLPKFIADPIAFFCFMISVLTARLLRKIYG